MQKERPKIGLALGCGGTRGYAHIGVIKVLERNKISLDFITGSSVGAVIGSHYALFRDIQKLEEIVLSTNWRQILPLIDFSFRGGIIRGMKTAEFINQILKNATFPQLKIPFVAIATDFKNGEMIELSEGKVAPAVQASMSVPFLFKPILLQGKLLFDGGISDCVPIETTRRMGADIVIAVNLINKSFFDRRPFVGGSHSLQKSLNFLHYNLAKRCAESADVVIEPRIIDLGFAGISKLRKGRAKDMILEGEKSAELALPRIKELIG